MVKEILEKLKTLVVEDKKADVVIVDREFFDTIIDSLKALDGDDADAEVSMTVEQFADFIEMTVELDEKNAYIKKLEAEIERCKDKVHLLELQLKSNESVYAVPSK